MAEPKCYCEHTAAQHHTAGKKLCKFCPEYYRRYSGHIEEKIAGCLGLRLPRVKNTSNEYGKVEGESLQGNQRFVSVTKRASRGKYHISVTAHTPGVGKPQQACISPDAARDLADILIRAAKDIEATDATEYRRKAELRKESEKRTKAKYERQYRERERKYHANELAKLEGKKPPYPEDD